MRIYISGKMKDKDYHVGFALAEEALIDKGHIAVNPAVLPKGLDSNKYMPICLSMVDSCDAIVMIEDDWKDSQGAMLEMQFAKYQGKMVYFDIEDVPFVK